MRRLLLPILAVAIVGAGAVAVWRVTQSTCTADNLPARIGIYQEGGQTQTSVDQLPPRSGLPSGRPAVVVDLIGDGTCPSYSPDQNDLPLSIWLRVAPNLHVGYTRGGGP